MSRGPKWCKLVLILYGTLQCTKLNKQMSFVFVESLLSRRITFTSDVKVANRAADIVLVLTVLEYSHVVIFAKKRLNATNNCN